MGKGVERIQCFTGARYLVLPIVYEMDYLGRAVLGPFIPDDLLDLPPRCWTSRPPSRRRLRTRTWPTPSTAPRRAA